MTVHEKIKAVFTAADVSGYLNYWRPTADESKPPQTLAIYNVTREKVLVCADDAAKITQHDVQIDVYSVADPADEVDDLTEALQNAKFYIPSREEVNDMVSGDYRYHVRLNVFYID